MAVSKLGTPSGVFVYDKKTTAAQSVFNVYTCHYIWYLYKTKSSVDYTATRALLLQSFPLAPQCALTPFVTLCASLRGQSKASSGEGDTLKPLRPASVAASPLCMKRQQAGVITPVPSTVRSGTSMVRIGRETHHKN